MAADNVRTMSETTRATRAVYLPKDGKTALEEVIRAAGHDPFLIGSTIKGEFAQRLSDVARKDPPWTYRYIDGVLKGTMKASPALLDAIMRLGALIDGAPVEVAKSTQVVVMAAGTVAPGALILADSRRCANPGCRIEFVPRVPWQRCHSSECARVVRGLRKEGKNG